MFFQFYIFFKSEQNQATLKVKLLDAACSAGILGSHSCLSRKLKLTLVYQVLAAVVYQRQKDNKLPTNIKVFVGLVELGLCRFTVFA